jgi:predicted DNA-binding transcriptional regulator YafY
LLLDDEEAVAVAVGLRTAASGTVSGIEEASVRVLAKLQQVLPARLRRQVTALHSFILPLGNMGPTVDAEALSVIASACRDHEELRFNYRSRDGAPSKRQVEPHRLVHTGRRWYLVAWDVGRADWRTFRVDRIEPRLGPGLRFSPRDPPEGGFAEFVTRSVAWMPQMHQVKVTLHVSAGTAAERIPPGAGMLEAVDEHRCILHTGASSLDTLSVYLALIDFDFEVLAPPELIERIRWLAERFTRASKLPG